MRTYALENRGRAPLYEYLYRCIRGDILDGTLTAGERLPSKRALAEGGRTLVDSGQLRNSIQVRSDATGFAVGTNVKHASTHQYGVKNRIIKAKNKKYLRFKVDGRWVTRKKVKVTIPARPFLGLSAEDQEELQETVEDFIRQQGE